MRSCVCVRERDRERLGHSGREIGTECVSVFVCEREIRTKCVSERERER